MSDIYIMKVEHNIVDKKFIDLIDFIDEEKKKTVNRYKIKNDSNIAVMSNVFLRYLLCRKLGLKNKDIVFIKNSYGKPLLKRSINCYFNISHSDDYIVCAIDRQLIGIDIEKVSDISLDVVDTFFHTQEYIDLTQYNGNKLDYFYILWTLKESYVKKDGRGLSIPLNDFYINALNHNKITIRAENDLDNCYFKLYNFNDIYRVAVCSLNDKFPSHINIVSCEEVVRNFYSLL